MRGLVHRICLCLIVFCLLAPAYGQTVLATLSGDVVDPSGKAVAGASVTATGRETGRTITASRNSAGFVEQVNGQDLSNWQGAVDSYEMKNGAIVCKPGKGGDLLTKEQFESGFIRVEFKLPPAGNNGIALRTQLGGHSSSDGLELQIIDRDGYNAKQAADGKKGREPYQYHG